MDDAEFEPQRKAAAQRRSIIEPIQPKLVGEGSAIDDAETIVPPPLTQTSRASANTPTSRQGSAAQPKTPAPKQRKLICQTKPATRAQGNHTEVTDRVSETLDQLDIALASADAPPPSLPTRHC